MIYKIINNADPRIEAIAKTFVENESAYITGTEAADATGRGRIICNNRNVQQRFSRQLERQRIYPDDNTQIEFTGEYITNQGRKRIDKFFIRAVNGADTVILGETRADEYNINYINSKNRLL